MYCKISYLFVLLDGAVVIIIVLFIVVLLVGAVVVAVVFSRSDLNFKNNNTSV